VSGYEIRVRANDPMTADNFADSMPITTRVVPAPPGSPQPFEIKGLLPETDYWVGVRAYDGCRNTGDLAIVKVSTTARVGSEVDACFVATAAYGSLMANDVELLRHFRDSLLETTVLGERTIPAEYRVDTIDLTLPDFVQRVDPTTPPTTRPAVAPPVTPPHNITPTRTPTHAAATDPEQLANDARRMANILTGDDGTHGFGGMAQRTPGADLNHQIDDARHRTITVGDNGHTSRTDDRARIGTDNHGLPIDDPTLTRVPGHADNERPGRIQITPIPGETGTTLTPQMVLDKINSFYLPGLQHCYSLGQKEDATLEGKIAIELTVDIHGRVTDPSASGLTSKVDGCISKFMTTWHFITPRDHDGVPTEATFKIGLVLKRG